LQAKADDLLSSSILTSTIENYIDYAINPQLPSSASSGGKAIDLFGLNTLDISLRQQTSLLDYEGELFINQAVEYMKYAEIANGIELMLDKLSLLEQPKEVSYIMEEKQKVEKELVKIDEEILNLMKLYDGLMTSKKGILLDKDGTIKLSKTFIKKICYVDITMDNVGINNAVLFQAQKDNYINPETAYFSYIISGFARIENLIKQLEVVQTQITTLEEQIAGCQARLESLSSKQTKTAADNNEIKKLNKAIKQYKDKIKDFNKQAKEHQELIIAEAENIVDISDSVKNLIDELLPLHEEAMASLDKILEKSKLAEPLINGYESLLMGKKGKLSQEFFEGLEEELLQFKQYVSFDGGFNFPEMLNILENNKQVLDETLALLKEGKNALKNEDYMTAGGCFTAAEASLSKYRIQGLTLDYSTLVYDKENKNEALDKVNEAIASGISSLVIDPADISDAVLDDMDTLPSFIHALTEGEDNYSEPVANYFAESKTGEANTSSEELFAFFRKESSIVGMLSNSLDKLAEMILFREYLDEHFYSYQAKSMAATNKKPTVLDYEQEYLIIGKSSDAANLNAIITRILLIRMIFDFLTVVSSKNIRNEAKLIATGLVGFTGLPVLIYITQMLILLIWSFAEALLDTTAIMMGKKVPIYKKNVDMTFPEIFLLTREQLSKKALLLQETKEISLSYYEYIKIFLYMTDKTTLAYRSMDLIQENIRLRYNDDKFRMADCLYGFEVTAQFGIKSKFSNSSFLQKYYKPVYDSYQIGCLAADSY